MTKITESKKKGIDDLQENLLNPDLTLDKKLALLRITTGTSQKAFAKKLGILYATYLNWEKGKSIPRMDAIQKIANYYKIPYSLLMPQKYTKKLNEIVSNSDEKKEATLYSGLEKVPCYSLYEISFDQDISRNPIQATASIYTIENKLQVQEYVAVRMKGNSMSARQKTINDGSIVFCNKNYDPKIFLISSPVMLVVCKGEYAMIREVNIEDDIVILTPWNENYPTKVYPKNEVKLIAKVESVLNYI